MLGAVGLGSDGLLGREVGAQLTEQMTELRGIRGFEEAEEIGDLLWDKSKELTIGGVGWLESGWDWTVNDLPTLPGRAWAWLRAPVPTVSQMRHRSPIGGRSLCCTCSPTAARCWFSGRWRARSRQG